MRLKVFSLFFLAVAAFIFVFWEQAAALQSGRDGSSVLFREGRSGGAEILAAAGAAAAARPEKKAAAGRLDLSAKAAVSVYFPEGKASGPGKVLFEKNASARLPIASLTKIMAARVALEKYDIEKAVKIKKESLRFKAAEGKLRPGMEIKIKDIIRLMLIESDNNAAFALADLAGEKEFVELMNKEAEKMGMAGTFFANPTGLDGNPLNLSTAEDLVKLAAGTLGQNPFFQKTLSEPETDLYDKDGIFLYRLKSTNRLLFDPAFRKIIIGGKTGETPKSKQSLVLATKAPDGKGYLISVILDSEDRFGEMKKLIKWVSEAYRWPL